MSPFVVPGLGYKSKLLIAKESVYGTAPAAADHGMELNSASINPKISTIDDPSLSNTQESRRFIGGGGQSLEATFRIRVGYEGMLSLLRMFFPVYSNSVVDTSARSHVFKEASSTVPGFSYTLDFLWGDVPSGKANRLTGCYGQSIRITGQAGTGENAMLMCECTVVAKALASNTTPMTGGALPASLGVIYHQLLRTTNNFKDGSSNAVDAIQLRAMEYAVQKGFDNNRFLFGQVDAEQPVRNGFTEATMGFDEEWSDVNLMTAARANSPTGLKVLFQHPTVIGATTAKREFEIVANSPTIAEYGTELPGFGVITQKASYKLAYNVSDASHTIIRVQTTEAAMTY